MKLFSLTAGSKHIVLKNISKGRRVFLTMPPYLIPNEFCTTLFMITSIFVQILDLEYFVIQYCNLKSVCYIIITKLV